MQAVADRDASSQHLTEASAAVVAAQAALDAAMDRQAQMLKRFSAVAVSATEADKEHKIAEKRRTQAEEREAALVTARELAEKEEKALFDAPPPEVEESRRREALEESIRRMRALREEEEADRRRAQREKEEDARREQREREEAERARKEAERLAREERERRVREEAERKAREERERKEAEARRLSAYKRAAAIEGARCRTRDAKFGIFSTQWTTARSLQWFKDVSVEFEAFKFGENQPLTFGSVPWPLLAAPHKMTPNNIDWDAVEAFFAAVKLQVTAGEYKVLVEKAHRRFHPDKWRSRGLLTTILDEDLRQQLENAGNIVAQAITPIWLETKIRT